MLIYFPLDYLAPSVGTPRVDIKLLRQQHASPSTGRKTLPLTGEFIFRPIHLYSWMIRSTTDEHKTLANSEMIFRYTDIESDFNNIMRTWFDVRLKLDTALKIYFSVRNNPDIYLEYQFIGIVQALEGYHRICFSNEILPRDDYERRKKDILSSVSEEHLPWFKARFAYGNEPSLRIRLHDLIEYAGKVIQPWIDRYGGVDEFTRRVAKVRGAFTHPVPRKLTMIHSSISHRRCHFCSKLA